MGAFLWKRQCWVAGAAEEGKLSHGFWVKHFWRNWQSLRWFLCCGESIGISLLWFQYVRQQIRTGTYTHGTTAVTLAVCMRAAEG